LEGWIVSVDLKYLDFGDAFEQKFLSQSYDANRTLDESMAIAWAKCYPCCLRGLLRLRPRTLTKYFKARNSSDVQPEIRPHED